MLRSRGVEEQGTSELDPKRALRTIRILGAANLLLLVALGGSLWWSSRAADALRINTRASVEDRPTNVFLEARLASGGRAIRSGDTVTDPTIIVQGKIADFSRLRVGLDGLSVTVRGTRVDILPETGEFTERVVLIPGRNQIDLGIWWDGREWQRRHVEVIYLPQDGEREPDATL